jgi:hypothetical protein
LHGRIDRQIADIVFIQLQGELLLERHGVKAARGGKSPIDQLVRNAVVQGIKETDVFTGMRDFGSNAFERSRRTGEIGAVIDYPDLTGGRSRILDSLLLEKMHPVSPDRAISQI